MNLKLIIAFFLRLLNGALLIKKIFTTTFKKNQKNIGLNLSSNCGYNEVKATFTTTFKNNQKNIGLIKSSNCGHNEVIPRLSVQKHLFKDVLKTKTVIANFKKSTANPAREKSLRAKACTITRK